MSLAAGLVIVSFTSGIRIDLMAYLIGDILAVSRLDLLLIWLGAGIILLLIIWRWSPLLLVTLNEDLASASGLNPKKEGMILTLALATVVAVGIKVVGVLLIIAMLIIPAASARSLVSTPEGMGVVASVIGVSSAILGLNSAYIFDTPTGPSIVCVASIFFIVSLLVGYFLDQKNKV
jgi:zinc transport system permease protein